MVGGEEVEVGEGVERGPADFVVDAVGELALEAADGEELEIDGAAVAVVVADVGDEGADGGVDAEFFVELAAEGLLGGFSGLDFASGKLPLEAHGLIGAALTDENGVSTQDQRGRHIADGLVGVAGGGGLSQGGFL